MKLEFLNYDTRKKIDFETEKHLIAIYGKNGSGKTTLSRTDLFNKKYVFNEDFIYSNVFNVSEKGFTQTSTTKENFSGLWLGENIVKIRQEISKIKEQEKEIKDNIQQISSKYIKFFSEQGIPFNYEQKTKEVKNDNFNLTDETISMQASKYVASHIFKTDIKNKEELKEKITYLKKNDIYNNLISKIQNNKLLRELLLKEKNNYITTLNNKIYILKKNQEIIKETENVFKEEQITDDIKIKIHEWYLIHESKDHCIFCGNKNIKESLEKWKNIFTNTNIKEKQNIITELNSIIDDCNKIINEKIYQSVDEEIIQYINTITETIKMAKSMIEAGNYESINFDLKIKNIKIIEIKELTDNIINYSINQSINNIEFYYNAQLYNENLKKKKTNELDKLMDTEGEIIAGNINDIFKDLGLNKNINITVDKHSVPHKFAYSIKNHKDVNELSDGQKHKLALAIFMNSIITDDLTDKVIVIDDPVVSLDVIGYQNVRNVIAELTKKFDEETTKLIILTHDINYLYIQLSNIFDNPDMSLITEVYKFCDTKFKPVSLEILNVDDITLYKFGIKKAKYINDVKALATLNCKLFRILIDLKARFQGTPISSNVDVEAILIDENKKAKLREISNYFSKVYKKPDIIDAELMESFSKINETCSLLELYELISQEELDNISSIISKNEFGENDSEVFDIINQVSKFIRTTTNMNLRNYISHPRNYFTKNIVTLSLDNEL